MRKSKKLIVLLMTLVMACMAAGCAKSDSGKSELGFKPSGAAQMLVPGEKFDIDSAGLGETTAYMEAASCYFDGLDKVYSYNGYDLTTYPGKDGEYIQDISISSADIKTDKGIGIGSTLAQVEKAYGTDYRLAGKMYQYYQEDNKYMYFFIMDDVVKYYGYAIEVR